MYKKFLINEEQIKKINNYYHFWITIIFQELQL